MRSIAGLALVAALSAVPDLAVAQGCMDASGDEEGVSVLGFIQPQLEYQQRRVDDQFSFTFNRARLGVVGKIPYDFSYYVFTELSPFKHGAPHLLDGFITYTRFAPHLMMLIGQFKPPFSLELNTSCAGLLTVDRSIVVRTLASPDRDLGAMLYGDLFDTLFYSLAVMNGRGQGLVDDNIMKDIVGRAFVRLFDHVQIGGSARYGEYASQTGRKRDDTRTVLGAELRAGFGDFLFQSEYIYSHEVGSYTTGGDCEEPLQIHAGTVSRSGMYALAAYMLPWDVQPVVRYELWFPDLGENEQEQVVTFGANYFFNDWVRAQINYLYRVETVEIKNDAIVFQLQAKMG